MIEARPSTSRERRVRRTLRSAVLLVGAAMVLRSAASAQGGPPLRTDDPGTPGDGRFEIVLAATLESWSDVRSLEAPLLDVNYGLGERVQLKYEVPWVFVDEQGVGERDGLGNSLVGVKWRFRDASGRTPALSIYPQVEFENPGSSSTERGVTEAGTSLLVPLEAAWDLGGVGVNLEVGRTFRDLGDDQWIAGLALGRSLSEHLELLAEVHGEASADLESSHGVLDLGSRCALAPGRVLLAAVGSGLWSAESVRPELIAYVGIQLQF